MHNFWRANNWLPLLDDLLAIYRNVYKCMIIRYAISVHSNVCFISKETRVRFSMNERIVENEAKEVAISSYSGWNIVPMLTSYVSNPRFTPSISNYRQSRGKRELQPRCQVQQAYPPYTLQLMRNYCRT